nr:tachykinin receptor long subtype [Haliotis discus hannai]
MAELTTTITEFKSVNTSVINAALPIYLPTTISPTNTTNATMDLNGTTEVLYDNNFNLPWWQQLLFITMFVAMFVVAAGGNIIVIWIVLAHKRMRTVTNYFLVNLAVADVLISLLNTPFNFVYNMYQDWWFGAHYCRFSMFISPCAISVSVLTFTAIAIDRYMAIIHPLRPRLTGRIVLTIIVAIWKASFLLSLPNLLYSSIYLQPFKDGSSRSICFLQWPDGSNTQSKSDMGYNILLMILNYFLPMVTLAGTYARIGWELWGSKAIGETIPMQAERIKSKRKVVKMMMVVVVIFAVCWLPTHLYFIIGNIRTDVAYFSYIQQIYLLIYWLAMSNSMYNPIIYCWMNARFRQGFLRFFRWCPFRPCKKTRRMVSHERAFYSTRTSMTASEKYTYDRNGSLMHTTMDSLDDTTSTPSVYRMHPIVSKRTRDDSV